MSSWDEEELYDPAYEAYEEPATAEDQLTEAFYADPAGTIGAIAGAAAELRAQQLAQQTSSQLHAINHQYSSAVSEQSASMAIRRMTETYGQEFEQSKNAVAGYLNERPWLQQAGLQDPNVALDVIDSAFQNVRANVRQENDKNEWDRVKAAGGYDWTFGR